MENLELKTKEWRVVRGLWEEYQSLEHVERGYNPDAIAKQRNKFYAAKAKYEKAFALKWHEDEPPHKVVAVIPAEPQREIRAVTVKSTVDGINMEPGDKVLVKSQPVGDAMHVVDATPELIESLAGIMPAGHNNPPADDPAEEFRRKMVEDYEDVIAEAEKLAKGDPKPCVDDAYAERLTVYTSKLTATIKKVEAARIAENKPVLEKQRMINGYFGSIKEKLEQKKAAAKSMLDPYLKQKAVAEQQARIAAAEQMQQQADALKASQQALYDAGRPVEAGEAGRSAEKIEKHAERLEVTAASSKANVAQVKVGGASASLRTRIVNEITDRHALDLEAIRPYLDIDALQKAVDIYFKLGGKDLRGVEVREITETVVR